MPATRRALDLMTFDQLTGDVERLRSNGYEQAGAWTLPQILDHLAKAISMSLDPTQGVPRPVRWMLKPILWRILRTRSMPRMPAPKGLRPAPEVDAAATYSRFTAAVAQAADLPGETVDHPAFGHISVYDWQQLHLVHASRHLSFLIPHRV